MGTSIAERLLDCLFHQPEIVQRVEHILLPPVAACMPSQQGSFKQDLHLKRIRFQRQFRPGLFRGDRVAIGFVGHLAVAIEVRLARDAALKRPRWQWTQVGLFFLPGLPNTDRLAMDHPHIVASAGCQQVAIEFLKRGHARHGHEKISTTKPHRLCRHLTPCRASVRTKNRCFRATEGASEPCESSISSSLTSTIFPLNFSTMMTSRSPLYLASCGISARADVLPIPSPPTFTIYCIS